MTQKMAEENGLAVEKIAGCGLEELQKMDPTELLRIGREVLAQGDGLRFRPCVDGCVLPEDPGTVFARGDAADESLMMGTVTGDAGTFGLAGGDADSGRRRPPRPWPRPGCAWGSPGPMYTISAGKFPGKATPAPSIPASFGMCSVR